MIEEDKVITCKAMWVTANQKLESAKLLLAAGFYNDSLSRSYYACFHGISLLFFCYGKSFSKHSTLIGSFNKEFVFTGVFSKKLGKAMNNLYESRQAGDYDVFQTATLTEAQNGLSEAHEILNMISIHCKEYFNLEL